MDNDQWYDKEIACTNAAAGDFTGSPIAANGQHKLSEAIGDVEILQKNWNLFFETFFDISQSEWDHISANVMKQHTLKQCIWYDECCIYSINYIYLYARSSISKQTMQVIYVDHRPLLHGNFVIVLGIMKYGMS